MRLDEEREAELEQAVARLDGLVPRHGAHLTIPAGPDGHSCVGNRLGYLRLGIEILKAALRPVPASDDAPARVLPQLGSLLTEGSATPFDLCEIDESIASRPPVASALGPIGQLGAGILVVAAVVLLFIGAAVVWRWLLG